jgi:serine/threonine protein kinase
MYMCVYRIARDILPVLSELARRRIVHSDVKPDNILWDRNADAYKLADFGLAFNSMSPPPQGELRGSLVYLPPDAFVQLRTSFASDMWAFGGTLLDTFLSDSAFDSGTMHLQEELPRNWVEWIGPIPEWLKLGLRQAGFIVPDKSYNLPLLDQLAIRSPAPGMRNFIDFLRKCFDYHPLTRMTATGALEHPFVTGDRY